MYRCEISNTKGANNVFLGEKAGYSNTTGSNTVFIGNQAGYSNTTSLGNIFLGGAADYAKTTGIGIFIGEYAGYSHTTGIQNIFLGANSGHKTTTGEENIFLGTSAGFNNIDGKKNLYLGHGAGFLNVNGTSNIFLGSFAGASELDSNKLYIDNNNTTTPLIYGEFDNNKIQINGDLTVADTAYVNNKIKVNPTTTGAKITLWENNPLSHFGFGISNAQMNYHVHFSLDNHVFYNGGTNGDGAEVMRIFANGGIQIAGVHAYKATAGNWLSGSDKRLKTNVQPLSSEQMLNNLLALKGVTYEWADTVTGKQRPDGIHYGFIAQNIQDVFPTLVNEDEQGYLQTAYGTYDAMTVEAIRALNDKIETKDAKIEELEAKVAQMNEQSTSILQRLEALESSQITEK